MFLYEKNNKLNFQFDSNIPANAPTLELNYGGLRVGSTIVQSDGEIVTKQVMVGNTYFDTLQEAIENAEAGSVICLLASLKISNFKIAEGKEVTIDLNGYKIENDGNCDTITNKGKLTIIDSVGIGEVDNTVNKKCALYNMQGAVAVLRGGIFNRSKEAGTEQGENGNTYYTIVNQGTMTIKDGVKVYQNNGSWSSLVENGWYDGSQNTSKVDAVLVVEGGRFENGLNTIKNDDFGSLTIKGGKFTTTAKGTVIMNWNKCTVSGGEFTALSRTNAVIANGYINDESDKGLVTINGGTFNAKNITNTLFTFGIGAKDGGKLIINGGTFNGKNNGTDLTYVIVDENNILK